MAQDFEKEVDVFIGSALGKIDKFLFEFSQELSLDIIQGTPVDTGFLRASWTASVNVQDSTTTASFAGPKGGGEAVNGPAATEEASKRIANNLSGVAGGDSVYISNNVEYGPEQEFGSERFDVPFGGRAFVRGAVNDADRIAQETLAKIKNE